MRGPSPKLSRMAVAFGRDRSGATAIEFAIIVTPFLMLIFAVIGIGLVYFTETVLDQALTMATRQIRTGQSLQTSTGELTVGNFKKEICAKSGGLISCSKLSVIITSADSWDKVGTIPSCTNTAGSVVPSNYSDSDNVSSGAGGRERVVIVVACYPWELLATLPYIKLGNANGGAAQLIQSVRAFKSEPY